MEEKLFLSWDDRQYYSRGMFVIVKDGLFGAYPFRICAEGMARVGIPVDKRKITAGDGDS